MQRIGGGAPPPPIEHGRMARLEQELARERSARVAAEERAAALQARLSAAEDEVERLRRLHGQARGAPAYAGQPLPAATWRPPPVSGVPVYEPPRHAEASRDSRRYSPPGAGLPAFSIAGDRGKAVSQVYSTQTSSPPALQPAAIFSPLSGAPSPPHPSSPPQSNAHGGRLENGRLAVSSVVTRQPEKSFDNRGDAHLRLSMGADAWWSSAHDACDRPSPSASSPGKMRRGTGFRWCSPPYARPVAHTCHS